MGTTSTLGIPKMADSDPLSDVAEYHRDAVEFIDDMLDLPAPAWGAAAAGAIAAGTPTSMGSIAIPACNRNLTLHLALMFNQTAGTASHGILSTTFANTRADSALSAFSRFPTPPSASIITVHFALSIVKGSDTTALPFTFTPVLAVAAGARLRGWFS